LRLFHLATQRRQELAAKAPRAPRRLRSYE
jgi:hypothetical protein